MQVKKFYKQLENSNANKSITCTVLLIAVFCLFTPDAFAMEIPSRGQSIGSISKNITLSLSGASSLVTALAYLGALTFAFVGALKWKAYGEQPDRTPLKVPVTYMAIAAILAALPEFLGTGISTIWGQGATVLSSP